MQTIIDRMKQMNISSDTQAAIVSLLETPNDIQVINRLKEPEVCPRTEGMKTVAFLDTETTGVNTAEDEMIELGYVIMEFSNDGTLGDVVKIFNELNEPRLPIMNSSIHGIDNDMVKGKAINLDTVKSDIDDVNLIIAHNSGFDRKIVERYSDCFAQVPWACTFKDIDWKAQGINSHKLEFLAYACKFFYDAHRATIDVFATIEIVKRLDLFKELLLAALQTQYILSAKGSPFSKKDTLKERGYKPLYIAGKFISWYTSVNEAQLKEEQNWLMTEGGCRTVPVKEVTSMDRYSTREAF